MGVWPYTPTPLGTVGASRHHWLSVWLWSTHMGSEEKLTIGIEQPYPQLSKIIFIICDCSNHNDNNSNQYNYDFLSTTFNEEETIVTYKGNDGKFNLFDFRKVCVLDHL